LRGSPVSTQRIGDAAKDIGIVGQWAWAETVAVAVAAGEGEAEAAVVIISVIVVEVVEFENVPNVLVLLLGILLGNFHCGI
jgi:hypothetical protein